MLIRPRPAQPSTAVVAAIFVGMLAPLAAGATIHVPRDFASIQSAIDAASAGDTVLVRAGEYVEQLHLKPSLTLRSEGDQTAGEQGLRRAEATIINGRGRDGTGVKMAEDTVIDGFTITNFGHYDDAEWQKHHDTHGNQQEHAEIGQPGPAGIAAVGVRCTIRNNIVHHTGSTGIAIVGSDQRDVTPHVERNVCYRNMGAGIGALRKSSAIIEGNVCFENFYAGIGHNDASPLVVNNDCYQNIRAGIGISHHACPIVKGNRCYQNRRAGIGIRSGKATRPIIEANRCYENEMAGIGSELDSSPLIRGNRCYKNRLAGIGVRTGATPTIIANESYENRKAGIGAQSDAQTVLIGNHVHGNETAGIGFEKCESGQSTVINNRIVENRLVDIGIHSGWKVYLEDNTISRTSGMPPIVMVFQGAEARLVDNNIRGGGVAAIRVLGKVDARNNDLIGIAPRRRGPPNVAIWALPGAVVNASDNQFNGWRHALHARQATTTMTGNTIRQFFDTAFVIEEPSSPPRIVNNTAFSKDPQAKLHSAGIGHAAIIEGNRIQSP